VSVEHATPTEAAPEENRSAPSPSTNGLTPPSLTGAGRRFLSDLIVELGFVDAEIVAGAVEAARRPGLTVEKVLLEQGALTEDQLSRALAERYGLDHIDVSAYPIDPSAAALLQEAPARG
jgi:type IV pilus assembly protein PilB